MQAMWRFLCFLLWTNIPVGSASTTHEKRQDFQCDSLKVRRSWTSLSNEEKRAYLDAVKCLMVTPAQYGIPGARTVWDEQQYAHAAGASFAHGTAAFLAWHRLLSAVHEALLSKYCDYQSGVPYWDEFLDVDNLAGSAIFDSEFGFGGDGRPEDDCVTDGPFAGLTLVYNRDVTVREPECLRRRLDPELFRQNGGLRKVLDECLEKSDWESEWKCLEYWPHAAAHLAIGGHMQEVIISAGDPVFPLHHNFVDLRLWTWQLQDLSRRLTQVGGRNMPSDEYLEASGMSAPGPQFWRYSGDPGRETTLDHVLWTAGILPNVTIRDVMDIRGPVICATYE